MQQSSHYHKHISQHYEMHQFSIFKNDYDVLGDAVNVRQYVRERCK